MDRVKELVEAEGLTLAEAVKAALRERGLSVSGLARRYDLHRGSLSEVLHMDRYPSQAFCDALAGELGGTPAEWADAFVDTWQTTKRQAIAA